MNWTKTLPRQTCACAILLWKPEKRGQAFDYRLLVMNGIEMGQAIQNKEKAQEILRRYRFDFVLGSLHCIRGMDDFAYIDFSDLDVDVILTRYFEEILELCQWGQFDSLAHLTYPLRYIAGQSRIPVDLSRYDSIIDEILRTLAQKGLGLEINTAGLRREIGQDSSDPAVHQAVPPAGRRDFDLRFGCTPRTGPGSRLRYRHRDGKGSRILLLCLL